MGQRGSILRTHPLQIGSRVSCRAGLFDGLTAKWSELTFGAGGSEERVFGWVSSLSDDGRRFKVDWDISVPAHDPRRASNANSLGRSSFSAGMLQRHDPRAGMRDVALPQESLLANRLVLQQQEIEGDDGDEMARMSKMDSGGIDVDLGAEDEDEDDPDYDPDLDEEVKGDHELPTQIDTDGLLQGFLSSRELLESLERRQTTAETEATDDSNSSRYYHTRLTRNPSSRVNYNER
eukprot:COSAG05_NODE_5102_length_1262_cov_4.781599_1_plen_235_part_00